MGQRGTGARAEAIVGFQGGRRRHLREFRRWHRLAAEKSSRREGEEAQSRARRTRRDDCASPAEPACLGRLCAGLVARSDGARRRDDEWPWLEDTERAGCTTSCQLDPQQPPGSGSHFEDARGRAGWSQARQARPAEASSSTFIWRCSSRLVPPAVPCSPSAALPSVRVRHPASSAGELSALSSLSLSHAHKMAPLAAVWRRLPTATSLLIGILVGLFFANVSRWSCGLLFGNAPLTRRPRLRPPAVLHP